MKAHDITATIDETRWFAEDVRPHESALRGYLRNSFPSVDIEDVMQESYLKLLKARAAGRVASTKAYVFSIARNTAITLFHRRRIYSEVPVNELPAWRMLAPDADAVAIANAKERIQLVVSAINRLPSRCREVMRLAVLHGMTNDEIARELVMAENTVRVHLGRGLKKCADYLRELGERP